MSSDHTRPEQPVGVGRRPVNGCAEWKVLGASELEPPRLAGIRVADTRYHLHMPGTTGAGKSTLLANLVLQDAAAGRGAVVIDPKGDLIRDLLDRLPETVADRLVLVDPAETIAPVALNVLNGSDPWRTAEDLVAILRRIFAAYWGPRTDDLLRCSCLTLARHRASTLADIPRILTQPGIRAPFVHAVRDDPDLTGFWAWYTALSPAAQANTAGPLLSRLRTILAHPFMAALFGTATSTFDLLEILDGGLLLARLPKGGLGEDTARLAGSILVAKIWQATLAREHIPEERRRDAALYVDECQNFLNLACPVDEMLAEARGYRLSIVLAHQHFGQLGTGLARAISANALNKIVFRLEPDDARTMAAHFAPALVGPDLAGLGGHRIACRIQRDGKPVPVFTLRTLPSPPPVPGRADVLRAASRRHGLDARARREAQHLRSAPFQVAGDSDAEARAEARAEACADARALRNETSYARPAPDHNASTAPGHDRDSS